MIVAYGCYNNRCKRNEKLSVLTLQRDCTKWLFICKTKMWSDILALPEDVFNRVLPYLLSLLLENTCKNHNICTFHQNQLFSIIRKILKIKRFITWSKLQYFLNLNERWYLIFIEPFKLLYSNKDSKYEFTTWHVSLVCACTWCTPTHAHTCRDQGLRSTKIFICICVFAFLWSI